MGGQVQPPFEGWATLYTNAPAVGKMPAREEPMPKPGKKAKQAFWERGYLAHGYWLGKERLGQVTLGPKKEWDGIYRWRAANHSGEAATLDEAKRAGGQAGLVGGGPVGPVGKTRNRARAASR